jgi:hypothetical protein
MTIEPLQALLISIHESAKLLARAVTEEFHRELFKESDKAAKRRDRVSRLFDTFDGSVEKQIKALKGEQYWL